MFDYLRDPQAIYQHSFEQVRAATDLSAIPAELNACIIRLVHACALPEIVHNLAWEHDPAGAGERALKHGAPVLCDCHMLASGITRARLPAANEVICTLGDAVTAKLAGEQQTTRSAAALELWRPHLHNAVVAIGNAPTALFRLLELLLEGAPRPAVILAFPIGFVGASEAKQALIDSNLDIPFLTLRGRFGGSALAAAAVNAIARP